MPSGKRSALAGVAIAHRLGDVPLGEASIVIAVAAGHRPGGFDGCRFLIDAIKSDVPIWKQESHGHRGELGAKRDEHRVGRSERDARREVDMSDTYLWLLPAVFVVAALYASVGHGGGSGYLALLAVSLGAAAVRIAQTARAHAADEVEAETQLAAAASTSHGGVATIQAPTRLDARAPRLRVAIPTGGAIGLVSGIVGVGGVGGGIFLSPIRMLGRWGTARQVAVTSAVFVLVNSIAGLVGRAACRNPRRGWSRATAPGCDGRRRHRSTPRRTPRRRRQTAIRAGCRAGRRCREVAAAGGVRMIRAGIVTASDTRSDGRAVDRATGPLRDALEQHDVTVVDCLLVPDEIERIEAAIVRLVDVDSINLVLTTGGTGLGPRDVTPEATRAVIEREVPGIAELLRIEFSLHAACMAVAGSCRYAQASTSGVNLPGSPRGAVECARVVLPLAGHALAVLCGAGHDRPDDAPKEATPT